MALTRSNMLELVHSYLNILNNEGPSGLMAVMTPDFTLKVGPKSLGLPPPTSLQAYIDLLLQAQKATGSTNTKFVLDEGFEPVIDENTHRIVLHLHSTADSSFGPAKNEFMIIFKTTPDGKKIQEQNEFMDSAAFGQLMQKLQAQ